ncbi:MAG: hypothetical protein RLZZ210_74 [Pseudomonadota bacterium]|jgi:mRNA interferase YafQ
MLDIIYTNQFKKDVKLCKKQNKNMSKFKDINDLLIDNLSLPSKYKNHTLKNNWLGYFDCHIEPDWVLIYKIDLDNNTLIYARMGSHSALFG